MVKQLKNPFVITSQYAGEKYFCDRVAETKELIGNIENSRNTVLISPRRMGKSGLVMNCFAQNAIKSNYSTIFVDIFSTSTAREFVLLFGKEVFKVLKSSQKRFSEKFFQYVKSLAYSVTLDPVTGAPSFNIQLGQIVQPDVTLEEIFNCLEASPKPCVVAIDEFQEIADYPEKNMVALLRTFVQRCNQTRFIFSGSKRRMMHKLFNSPSEPFYMSCRNMFLEPIDREKYFSFAREHFNEAKKELDKGCFNRIYDTFEGHTWYIQHLLNQLYQDTVDGDTAGEEMVDQATATIILSYSRTYQDILNGFSDKQKELLIAIAKEGKANQISSSDFVRRHSLSSVSSVQSAARTLFENETLTVEGETCYITNRFFSLWLKERY